MTSAPRDRDYFFHGPEPVTADTYRVCVECGHAFEARELLDAHTAILADVVGFVDATDDPAWCGVAPTPPVDPADVHVCPLCTHSF